MKLFTLFTFFLLFTCCETDLSPASVENPPVLLEKDSIARTLVDILIFKKEKKLELWENSKKNKAIFIKKVDLINEIQLLLGSFVSKSGKMELNLPGKVYTNKMSLYATPLHHNLLDFSERKILMKDLISAKDQEENPDLLSHYLLSQVFILPNDARSDGKLNPCINCPHWMVEVYGNLELQLKRYPIPNS